MVFSINKEAAKKKISRNLQLTADIYFVIIHLREFANSKRKYADFGEDIPQPRQNTAAATPASKKSRSERNQEYIWELLKSSLSSVA